MLVIQQTKYIGIVRFMVHKNVNRNPILQELNQKHFKANFKNFKGRWAREIAWR